VRISNSTYSPIQQPSTQPIDQDGTFRIEGVLPGQYRVRVEQLPADFYLKEARFDQIDVLNSPLQFTGSYSQPLEILLSPKAAQISGTVVTDKSEGAPRAQVVLIPDRNRDRLELYKTATTDQNGRFTIRGIAPGEYRVFAWEAIEQYGWFDPDRVLQSEPQASRVRISESEKLTLEVKLIPATF